MFAITKRSGFPLAQLVLLLDCTMQHDPNPVRRGRRHSGFSSVMSTPAFCNNRSNQAMSWVAGGCSPLLSCPPPTRFLHIGIKEPECCFRICHRATRRSYRPHAQPNRNLAHDGLLHSLNGAPNRPIDPAGLRHPTAHPAKQSGLAGPAINPVQ